jgi:hypothetical protein
MIEFRIQHQNIRNMSDFCVDLKTGQNEQTLLKLRKFFTGDNSEQCINLI